MKKIEAIIKPFMLEDVQEMLAECGLRGMTVADAKGFGRQRGHTEVYRGSEYEADFLPKLKIDILVRDEDVDRALAAIIEGAKTGKIGDGKVFVTPVDEIVRIRTGERNKEAV
ncbi:MAG: P-II family nitrogen regulator [Verrucomicrobiota bacterium]